MKNLKRPDLFRSSNLPMKMLMSSLSLVVSQGKTPIPWLDKVPFSASYLTKKIRFMYVKPFYVSIPQQQGRSSHFLEWLASQLGQGPQTSCCLQPETLPFPCLVIGIRVQDNYGQVFHVDLSSLSPTVVKISESFEPD